MATATATTQASGTGTAAQASIPFPIASRKQSRASFTLATVNLSGALQPQTPTEIPATGFLRFIDLFFSLTATGGTPQVTADAPFSLLASIGLRTSDGTPILVPVTGYQLFLINKYGGQNGNAPFSDPRNPLRGFVGTAASFAFALRIPFEIDASTGLGAVPALASNRSYQLDMTFNSISSLYGATTPPTGVAVNTIGIAHYWAVPVSQNDAQLQQASSPTGLGTLARWQLETPPVTPGNKFVKSNNVGGVLGCLIWTIRDSSGVRQDAALPALTQLYLDNEPQTYWSTASMLSEMSQQFALDSATPDTYKGYDNGVRAVNWIADGGSIAGDPIGTRAQMLSTLDATLLQLMMNALGGAASTLEILTQTVSSPNAGFLYAK